MLPARLCCRISLPKTSNLIVFFPEFFAEYIKVSAILMASLTSMGGLMNVTTPMLKVTGHPCSCTSCVSLSRIRSMKRRAAFGPVSGSRIANSSPPSRATVSVSRMSFFMLCATACKSRSPTECPKRSLTALKSSKVNVCKAQGMAIAPGPVYFTADHLAKGP